MRADVEHHKGWGDFHQGKNENFGPSPNWEGVFYFPLFVVRSGTKNLVCG